MVLNFCTIALFCHIFACFWHLVADSDEGAQSWIWRLNLEDSSIFERYVTSLYWIFQTVKTS